jgi:hypothetical protein
VPEIVSTSPDRALQPHPNIEGALSLPNSRRRWPAVSVIVSCRRLRQSKRVDVVAAPPARLSLPVHADEQIVPASQVRIVLTASP